MREAGKLVGTAAGGGRKRKRHMFRKADSNTRDDKGDGNKKDSAAALRSANEKRATALSPTPLNDILPWKKGLCASGESQDVLNLQRRQQRQQRRSGRNVFGSTGPGVDDDDDDDDDDATVVDTEIQNNGGANDDEDDENGRGGYDDDRVNATNVITNAAEAAAALIARFEASPRRYMRHRRGSRRNDSSPSAHIVDKSEAHDASALPPMTEFSSDDNGDEHQHAAQGGHDQAAVRADPNVRETARFFGNTAHSDLLDDFHGVHAQVVDKSVSRHAHTTTRPREDGNTRRRLGVLERHYGGVLSDTAGEEKSMQPRSRHLPREDQGEDAYGCRPTNNKNGAGDAPTMNFDEIYEQQRGTRNTARLGEAFVAQHTSPDAYTDAPAPVGRDQCIWHQQTIRLRRQETLEIGDDVVTTKEICMSPLPVRHLQHHQMQQRQQREHNKTQDSMSLSDASFFRDSLFDECHVTEHMQRHPIRSTCVTRSRSATCRTLDPWYRNLEMVSIEQATFHVPSPSPVRSRREEEAMPDASAWVCVGGQRMDQHEEALFFGDEWMFGEDPARNEMQAQYPDISSPSGAQFRPRSGNFAETEKDGLDNIHEVYHRSPPPPPSWSSPNRHIMAPPPGFYSAWQRDVFAGSNVDVEKVPNYGAGLAHSPTAMHMHVGTMATRCNITTNNAFQNAFPSSRACGTHHEHNINEAFPFDFERGNMNDGRLCEYALDAANGIAGMVDESGDRRVEESGPLPHMGQFNAERPRSQDNVPRQDSGRRDSCDSGHVDRSIELNGPEAAVKEMVAATTFVSTARKHSKGGDAMKLGSDGQTGHGTEDEQSESSSSRHKTKQQSTQQISSAHQPTHGTNMTPARGEELSPIDR